MFTQIAGQRETAAQNPVGGFLGFGASPAQAPQDLQDEVLNILRGLGVGGIDTDPGGDPGGGGGPAVGERRTIDGQLAEWDGQGWLAVQ